MSNGFEMIPLNTTNDKSYGLKANYSKSSMANFINGGCHYPQTGVAQRVDVPQGVDGDYTVEIDGRKYTAYKVNNKTTSINGVQYSVDLTDGYYIFRKMSIDECKKLQTVPDWYEFPVAPVHAYKMLGNGWTVDVISHILSSLIT